MYCYPARTCMSRGYVIGVGDYMYTYSLYRIDGDVSDTNRKVYGDGSAIFKILVINYFFLKVEMF